MEQISTLSSQLFPRNLKNIPTSTKLAKPTIFSANIFEINFKQGGTPSIYQFSYEVSPNLPADSTGLKQKIISTIYSDLKKLIGIVGSKGDMLWGRNCISKPQTLMSQFKRADEQYKFQVLIKQVKEINIPTFIKQNPQNLNSICQMLNINTKNMLRDRKMIELTPGNYYDKQIINDNQVEEYGFNVWRGYKINVIPYNGKLFLQADPCSRVLRQENFLVNIEKDRKSISLEEINLKYHGDSVLIKFGNLKIYRIDGIDFQMTPKSTFYYEPDGKHITYIEYYQKKYGYKIEKQNQPMVKIKQQRKYALKTKNEAQLNQKKQQQSGYIYLVPQMIVLTGLSEQQKSNYQVMKCLDPYTKLSPQVRMDQTQKIIQKLKKAQELMYNINDKPCELKGFKLDDPQIFLGKNRATIKNGHINLRQKVLDPHNFKNFIFCYSIGKDPSYDREDADFAIDQIIKASKTFQIKFAQPLWIQVDFADKYKNWEAQLQKQRLKQNENNRTEIIIFFLKPNQEKMYSQLKKFAFNQYNCHSQMIRRKSLSTKTKGVLSFASKIVLQMNSKIGCPLWFVPNYHMFWKDNTVAIAGLASSGGKKGLAIGIVGTTNLNFTSYFCQSKKIQSRDKMSAALFEGIYVSWLQNFFKKNKKLPKVLIIYRQGLNDIQAKYQFQFEVQGLLQAIKIAGVKTKTEHYDPRICYLLVNKKPNSKIYQSSSKGKNQTSYFNPSSGSIIFEDLSANKYKQFHLASVEVNQGSCTPVSFKIGYQKHQIPFDAIAEITYNQCYCYFNWDGPVRVPAALQYANKLSKLYSEIGQDLVATKGSQLKLTPFFL